jgi:hypothetical protein
MRHKEGAEEMTQINEMQNVGHAKYVVNYHTGKKFHADGSPFYDIAIFSNKRLKDRFVKSLRAERPVAA